MGHIIVKFLKYTRNKQVKGFKKGVDAPKKFHLTKRLIKM